MITNRTLTTLSLLFACGLAACASAPDTTDTTDPNAPDPSVLVAPDGGEVALGPIVSSHDATVLVWWASTCPCVKRYAERVRDLAARFGPRGVAFYYIASNADDGPEQVAAAMSSASLPILLDEGGALADRYEVTSTPTVVVLDRGGQVRYRGWLDNEHAPGDPDREAWLEDALGKIVAGGDDMKRTPTWGCMVTRTLGKVGRCHGVMPAPSPAP